MRVFVLAVVVVALLATTWSYTLKSFQETVAQATTSGSVRLDQQEAVNSIGREG